MSSENTPRPPEAEPRRTQMTDIARLAGVSVATVSRALNGGVVSEATRQRVLAVVHEQNYAINQEARSMRLQRSRSVAVVVPRDTATRQTISDPFFLSMVGAIANALTEHGLDMLLSRVDADRLDLAQHPVDSGRALGVLLIGQWHHHDQLNEMAVRRLPMVVWGAQLPQQLYCSVGCDNAEGGRLATAHLLARGRRRLAFLGDASLPEVMLRRQGHWAALAENGLQADPALELPAAFEVNLARPALEQFLATHTDIDGVVACSDLLASKPIQILRTLGRRVPEDVSVVGYDDIELAAYSAPPLTTVHQAVAHAGDEMVRAVLRLADGRRVPPCTLPVRLTVRESAP